MIADPKTVLFVTTFQLHPVTGGGCARVLAMVDYFRAQGLRVEVVTLRHDSEALAHLEERFDRVWIFAPKAKSAKQDLQARFNGSVWGKPVLDNLRPPWRLLKKMGRTIKGSLAPHRPDPNSAIGRNRKPGLDAFAAKVFREVRPIAVISECVWTARCLDHSPPHCIRILDTIDIQHLRFPTAKQAGYQVDRLACTRDEEVLELNRADLILAIQEVEAETLKAMCPDKRVLVVEHAHTLAETIAVPGDPLGVLFVGNYYEPNIIGLKDFLTQAWPRVREKIPAATLTVCGKVAQGIEETHPGVEFLGLVPSLEDYYRKAAVVVNPVPFGTGLKIKTVEALAHGKCLVSTECGVLGLPAPTPENPYCRVVPVAEMGDSIAAVLADPDLRRKHEECALRFAEERFSAHATYRELTEIIFRVPAY